MNRLKTNKSKIFIILSCLLFGFTVSAQNNAKWMQEITFWCNASFSCRLDYPCRKYEIECRKLEQIS